MAGVTTAPIPEDWGDLSGQSQEIPNSCTCLSPKGRQHEVRVYYKHITSQWIELGLWVKPENALMIQK